VSARSSGAHRTAESTDVRNTKAANRLLWRAAAHVARIGALVAGVAALSAPAASPARNDSPPAGIIPVSLGDVAKVTGAPIGCLVRRQNGERALDCRRTGLQVGSYGTVLTPTQVLVVRFESRKTARIVFQARHGKLRVHTCGG
jgi:hypothetical protein